jgi:hypothetical protein
MQKGVLQERIVAPQPIPLLRLDVFQGCEDTRDGGSGHRPDVKRGAGDYVMPSASDAGLQLHRNGACWTAGHCNGRLSQSPECLYWLHVSGFART